MTHEWSTLSRKDFVFKKSLLSDLIWKGVSNFSDVGTCKNCLVTMQALLAISYDVPRDWPISAEDVKLFYFLITGGVTYTQI